MNNSRLIIVEGLPGSGKSTTANMIAEELRNRGEQVVCVDEGVKNHPADYDDYDFIDFATERQQILNKWQEFVSNVDEKIIYVFNCIFLQNPMCETMMRFGMSEKDSSTYICEIADIIRPLKPKIVYIQQADEKKTIEKVLVERGNNWLNAVIDYHVNQGYGKINNLQGFDGYIKCLEERQVREINILKATRLDSAFINEGIAREELVKII